MNYCGISTRKLSRKLNRKVCHFGNCAVGVVDQGKIYQKEQE